VKIILISYFFSSQYETGGIRTQKFVKYLPGLGIEPIVLTRRVEHPFPFQGRCIFLRTLAIHWPFHLEYFTWIPSLLWTCVKLIKRERIEVLLFSCGPFPVAAVGVVLKKLFKVKLILDYRDYWTPSPYISKVSTFHRWVNHWLRPLERWILKATDRLILIQKEMEEHYLTSFPFLKDRTETIFNGFDEDDIPTAPGGGLGKFTLLYLGNLHLDLNPNYPKLFLESIKQLKNEGLLGDSNFQAMVVGERFDEFKKRIQSMGLSGIVKVLDRLPHSEAVHFLMQARLLLLIVETEGIITSKIFEYLASGTPILALIRPGELMDLIQEFSPESTVIVAYDSDEITRGVRKYLSSQGPRPESKGASERFRGAFNRRELTRQLANVIHTLA